MNKEKNGTLEMNMSKLEKEMFKTYWEILRKVVLDKLGDKDIPIVSKE